MYVLSSEKQKRRGLLSLNYITVVTNKWHTSFYSREGIQPPVCIPSDKFLTKEQFSFFVLILMKHFTAWSLQILFEDISLDLCSTFWKRPAFFFIFFLLMTFHFCLFFLLQFFFFFLNWWYICFSIYICLALIVWC